MKLSLPTVFRVGMLATTIGIFSIVVTSCTKDEDTDEASKFSGTWNANISCTTGETGTGPMVLTKKDNKTVTMSYSVGDASAGCAKAQILTGNASGNAVNFPSVTVADGCGLSYGLSAVGELNGSTLTLTLSVNGAINSTCTFTGTK